MECNKDEALRARDLAEKKMEGHDYAGAHKFVLRAQQLFPELDNVGQMLTVCSVHSAAETKILGTDMDWYKILQVEPTADDNSIKKQYKKLALLLHPDKNKYAGAESAFKLIGEAMRVLTDRVKRAQYDMKWKHSMANPRAHVPKRYQPQSRNINVRPSVFGNYSMNQSIPPAGINFQRPPQQSSATLPTFWTQCPSCTIKYQYYTNIMNKALKCQNCSNTFIAKDINITGTRTTGQTAFTQTGSLPQWNQCSNQPSAFNPTVAAHSVPVTGVASQVNAATSSAVPSKTADASDLPQTNPEVPDKVKIEESKQESVYKQHGNKKGGKRRRTVSSESSLSDSSSDESEEVNLGTQTEGTSTHYPRRSTRSRQNVVYNENPSDDDDFVKAPNSKKMKGSRTTKHYRKMEEGVEVSKNRDEIPSVPSDNEKDVPAENGIPKKQDQDEATAKGRADIYEQDGFVEDVEDSSESDSDGQSAPEPKVYVCPDAEFHEFDNDKASHCFAPNQVWAAYDTAHGLPRFYALVKKVMSADFKLQITWFESSPDTEEDEAWVDADLPIACGNFHLGETVITEDRLMFSHVINWVRGRGRTVNCKIYPQKGEIWALYKDWDSSWSSDPEKHKNCQFEIVEVLSNYSEHVGTRVVYMVKAKGFQSLFYRMVTNGSNATFEILPGQLCRFSHQVPAYRLRGDERQNIPSDSLELDPAALPSEFFEESLPSKIPEEGSIPTPRRNMRNDTNTGNASKDKYPIEANGDLLGDKENRSNGSKHPISSLTSNKDLKKEPSPNGCSSANVPGDISPESRESFHDFSADRRMNKIGVNEIWAVHDDVSMPRSYVQVKKLVPPDRVECHQLELCLEDKLDIEVQWFQRKLPISLGMYKPAKSTSSSIDSKKFSYLVANSSNSKISICAIYPRKGEIWLLYKDWRARWTLSDFKSCKYVIVEVMADYSAEKGVEVQVLEKVPESVCVFKSKKNSVRKIQRNQILRFSHKVPAFLLSYGDWRGYWELDRASVPGDLLA